MIELVIIFYILITLTLAYFWLYPKFVGENVKLMAWLDVAITAIPIALSGALFWESDPVLRWIFFDTNWFWFSLLSYVVIELPIFVWYLRARGLSKKYWDVFRMSPKGSPDAGWASASVESVEKQLNDTKWDGLRTRSSKKALLWISNLVMILGTVFLFAVGDSGWATYSLIHCLLLIAFWFLLRQSVRLVADAPEEALDEMQIQDRNRSYLISFRWMSLLVTAGASALLGFAILTDIIVDGDGFNYLVPLTWPQFQAIFGLYFGYSFMLPSMAMISIELKRKTKS